MRGGRKAGSTKIPLPSSSLKMLADEKGMSSDAGLALRCCLCCLEQGKNETKACTAKLRQISKKALGEYSLIL